MLVFHEIHTTRNYEKESCFIFIQRLAIKLEIKKNATKPRISSNN